MVLRVGRLNFRRTMALLVVGILAIGGFLLWKYLEHRRARYLTTCFDGPHYESLPDQNSAPNLKAVRDGSLGGTWEHVTNISASSNGRWALISGTKDGKRVTECYNVDEKTLTGTLPLFTLFKWNVGGFFLFRHPVVYVPDDDVIYECRLPDLQKIRALQLPSISTLGAEILALEIDERSQTAVVARGMNREGWDVGSFPYSSIDLIDLKDGRFVGCALAPPDRELPTNVPIAIRRKGIVQRILFLDRGRLLGIVSFTYPEFFVDIVSVPQCRFLGGQAVGKSVTGLARLGEDSSFVLNIDDILRTCTIETAPEGKIGLSFDKQMEFRSRDFFDLVITPKCFRGAIHPTTGRLLAATGNGLFSPGQDRLVKGGVRLSEVSRDGRVFLQAEYVGGPPNSYRVGLWRIERE